MMGRWPELGSAEDANKTHQWARDCLEMWEKERGQLLAKVEARDHLLVSLTTERDEARFELARLRRRLVAEMVVSRTATEMREEFPGYEDYLSDGKKDGKGNA